jgi:hypothetical protein
MHAYTLATFAALAFPAAAVVPQVRLISPCPPVPEAFHKINIKKLKINTKKLNPDDMELITT